MYQTDRVRQSGSIPAVGPDCRNDSVSEPELETDRSHPHAIGLIDIEPVRFRTKSQGFGHVPASAKTEREIVTVVGIDQDAVNRQPVARDHVLKEGDRVSATPVKIEGARIA